MNIMDRCFVPGYDKSICLRSYTSYDGRDRELIKAKVLRVYEFSAKLSTVAHSIPNEIANREYQHDTHVGLTVLRTVRNECVNLALKYTEWNGDVKDGCSGDEAADKYLLDIKNALYNLKYSAKFNPRDNIRATSLDEICSSLQTSASFLKEYISVGDVAT